MSIENNTLSDIAQDWMIVDSIDELTYRSYARNRAAAPNLMQATWETAYGKENVARFEARRLATVEVPQ
jgi:hypothetical protein